MSATGEALFPSHSGRHLLQSQDLTPYSAVCSQNCCFSSWALDEQAVSDQPYQVSSFNFPAPCDNSLMTPVSMVQSPTIPGKGVPSDHEDKRIKLSPSSSSSADISPAYHYLSSTDDEFGSPRYYSNPPMKHKDPPGALRSSSFDHSFPASPHICSTPYYGSFGVSAVPSSGNSVSSPSMDHSPSITSAGGLSSEGGQSRLETPQNSSKYRSQQSTPILIAPNPMSLRAAVKHEVTPYQPVSLQPISPAPKSVKASRASLPESTSSSSVSASASASGGDRKRKSPPTAGAERDMVLAPTSNAEDNLLLRLRRTGLQWKEIARRFETETSKAMTVAALQMRHKRLVDKLRVWTENDVLILPSLQP
jgi:hypothetical protein